MREYDGLTRAGDELIKNIASNQALYQEKILELDFIKEVTIELKRSSWTTIAPSNSTPKFLSKPSSETGQRSAVSSTPLDLPLYNSTPTSKASVIYNFSTACPNTASIIDNTAFSPLNRALLMSSTHLPLNDNPSSVNSSPDPSSDKGSNPQTPYTAFSNRSSLLTDFQVAPYVKASLLSDSSNKLSLLSGLHSTPFQESHSNTGLTSPSSNNFTTNQVSLLSNSTNTSLQSSSNIHSVTSGSASSLSQGSSQVTNLCTESSDLLSYSEDSSSGTSLGTKNTKSTNASSSQTTPPGTSTLTGESTTTSQLTSLEGSSSGITIDAELSKPT
ncbi:hypothetical protein DSO57_1008485 [Entomophthora muscae]|uniref:Uncharacterized protein n=1 Tax=Entomophthora muscae TaxID=34485 RepID=A0ACC2SVY4_9FUNG|nr:hypothetical protein DSO57_1008485 [Entomophthora muscae]